MHSVILHRFCSPVVLSHTLSVAVVVLAALLSVLVLSAVVLRHELLLHAYSAQSTIMEDVGVRLSQRLDSDVQSRLLSSWRWLRHRELLWTLGTWAGGGRHFCSMTVGPTINRRRSADPDFVGLKYSIFFPESTMLSSHSHRFGVCHVPSLALRIFIGN